MIHLKQILSDLNITQNQLCDVLGYSKTVVSRMLNHGVMPAMQQDTLVLRVREFLASKGASNDQIAGAFNNFALLEQSTQTQTTQEDIMSLRKQILHPNSKRHFKLVGDPFSDVNSPEEFYNNEDIRYARLVMMDTALRGGFLAVVGESGSGKTTLRRDLQERITQESKPIQIIKPYVLAMEDNDIKGKTLKSVHIVESIMSAIAPQEALNRSSEGRFRQVERALRESYRTGTRHVIVIEEAHALPLPTLRHLKRFIELEDGFSKLLSVILIGQTELALKLDPRNSSVREVVQRCEVITLPSLGSNLEDYLSFRFKRLGVSLPSIISKDGVEALRTRLEPRSPKGHQERSFLYPLAVHNLLTAAMNIAAEHSAPTVTGDIVMEVKWN